MTAKNIWHTWGKILLSLLRGLIRLYQLCIWLVYWEDSKFSLLHNLYSDYFQLYQNVINSLLSHSKIFTEMFSKILYFYILVQVVNLIGFCEFFYINKIHYSNELKWKTLQFNQLLRTRLGLLEFNWQKLNNNLKT